MIRISWCEVHNDRGNPNFNNHSCWTGTRGEMEAAPCEMTVRRLVPDDALVVERVDGEWPDDVLHALDVAAMQAWEGGDLATAEWIEARFRLIHALDTLAREMAL